MTRRLSPALRWVMMVVVLCVVASTTSGCAGLLVTAKPVSASKANRLVYASALTTRRPSPASQQYLRREALTQAFRTRPIETLRLIQEKAALERDPDASVALAELCYHEALRDHRLLPGQALGLYLASATHAYSYLFGPWETGRDRAYDPRFRLACDLYNGALAQVMGDLAARKVGLDEAVGGEGLSGPIDVLVSVQQLQWNPQNFGEFVVASRYQPRGMINHYRTGGLGVPLIAVRQGGELGTTHSGLDLLREVDFPVTAFLRVNQTPPTAGRVTTVLELVDPLRTETTSCAGRLVPLEADLTTPLAHFLDRYPELPLLGLVGFIETQRMEKDAGLYLVQPYTPGKIPVVMVHGLQSSPLTWLQMFNDLRGDPFLREHCQFWFFMYPTGNPIVYSASLLRQSLQDMRAKLDPAGKDAALDQMVLVGHSMGGLLSRTMIQNAGDTLWKTVSPTKSIEDIRASAEDRETLRKAFFFEPQPYVKRVVFIATPHRGSDLSENPLALWGSKLVKLPQNIVSASLSILTEIPTLAKGDGELRAPTSIESLSPNSPITKALLELPRAPGVPVHSIIGVVNEKKPKEEWSDRVVPYASAHLDDATSEQIVPEWHSCLNHPITILEVRRILYEHLRNCGINAPELTVHPLDP